MHIIKLDAIDSTNDHLRQLILESKLATPTVVWSLFQKKGKGQRGQVWSSQAGENLMFSLYIPNLIIAANQIFSINKIVSVCLADWFLSLQIPNVYVKWPNDILSVDKKISGILIENLFKGKKLMGSIVGVGINVNQITFPENYHAISMKIIMKNVFSLKKVLHKFLDIFSHNIILYKDFDLLIKDFNKSFYRKNDLLEYKIKGNSKRGKIIGLYDYERFQILNLNGVKETPKITDIKIIY